MDEASTPRWNLEEDLAGIWSFSLPIEPVKLHHVWLDTNDPARKRLRIEMPNKDDPVDVLSMADGYATTILSHTVVVTMAPLYQRLAEKFKAAREEEEASVPDDIQNEEIYIHRRLMERLPWYWFYQNWVQPDSFYDQELETTICRPFRIIYENIAPSPECKNGISCKAGMKIGTTRTLADEKDKGYLLLSLQYATADGSDRFMDPREFLSLLFWSEACDPLYAKKKNTARDKYEHPVLRTMQLGFPQHYDWLGLRPPLRTYKRVEWEAMRELRFHRKEWAKKKPKCLTIQSKSGGEPESLIRNPLIDYTKCLDSTCNVLAGDLAFRAGFRTFSKKGAVPHKLKYAMDGIWRRDSCQFGDALVEYKGQRYEIDKPYGTPREIENQDIAFVNDEITKGGKLIVFARGSYTSAQKKRRRHVVIVARIGKIRIRNQGTAELWLSNSHIIDQRCKYPDAIPKKLTARYAAAAAWCGWQKRRGQFVELIPGGDPSEDWGVIDLNCLKPKKSAP